MSGTRLARPVVDAKTRPASSCGVSERPHPELSSRDAWALEHITHCPTCGAWEVVTDLELRRRDDPGWRPEPWCAHVRPERVCR